VEAVLAAEAAEAEEEAAGNIKFLQNGYNNS
jgi:hypothetical protein